MARYREVPEDTVLWVMIIFLTIIIDVLYFYWHLLKHDHYYDYGDQHPIAISTMTTGTINGENKSWSSMQAGLREAYEDPENCNYKLGEYP